MPHMSGAETTGAPGSDEESDRSPTGRSAAGGRCPGRCRPDRLRGGGHGPAGRGGGRRRAARRRDPEEQPDRHPEGERRAGRAHGDPLPGLIGGTGSSPAGYECTGTYVYRGRRYFEGVPGSVDLPVGSTVHGVVASDDPALFSTPRTVATEHASAVRVALPAVVLVAAAGVCVWVVVRHRRSGPGGLTTPGRLGASAPRRATVAHGRRPGQAHTLGAIHPRRDQGRLQTGSRGPRVPRRSRNSRRRSPGPTTRSA